MWCHAVCASRNNNICIRPAAYQEFKVLFEIEEYLHLAEQENRILRKNHKTCAGKSLWYYQTAAFLCLLPASLWQCAGFNWFKGFFPHNLILKPANEHFCFLFVLMHSLDIFWPWKILRGCRKGVQIPPLV